MDLLMIGCPPRWAESLPGAETLSIPGWPPPAAEVPPPFAVLIGPEVEKPLLVARSVTQRFGKITILITSPSDELRATQELLTITPFVSPATRVVPLRDAAVLPEEIGAAVSTSRRQAIHHRELAAAERQRAALDPSGGGRRPTGEATAARSYDARERLYALIAESTDDAVFSMTIDGRVTGWNPAAERLYGRTEAEMLGTSFEGLVPETALAEHREIVRRAAAGQSARAVRVEHRDAARRSVLVSLTVSAIHDGSEAVVGVSLVARDITLTAELEARRAGIVASALDAIITIDARGIVVEFNPAAQAVFGYSEAEAVGQPLADLIIPPPFRSGHREGLLRQVTGKPSKLLGRRLEMPAMRRDGTEFPAELSIVRLEGTRDVLFTGFLRDMTQLRQAQVDLQTTVRTLERSNRDLEQFAYAASHDLQEPLRMVSSFMRLLQADYGPQLDETAAKYIGFATDGATRMKRLIDGLLQFSRVDTRGRKLGPTKVASVVGATMDALRLTIDAEGVTIDCGSLPTVMADPSQLGQVFQNLVANSIKFRGTDPPLVEIRAREDGDFWEFSVRDNGIGFGQEHHDRIFSMFQRLHSREHYEGSGIGLAIAKRIVERHGGKMWATSERGKGSCFYFTLHRAVARASEAP